MELMLINFAEPLFYFRAANKWGLRDGSGGRIRELRRWRGSHVDPGWTINGTVELISSGQRQGGMILIVPQGEHAVRLGNEAEIAQSVAVEKGAEYSVTFSAARTCAQLETLNVSVSGAGGTTAASSAVDLQTLYSVEGWDAYAWAFQAADDGAARLAFRNPGMEEDPTCGPILDNVAIKKLFTPDPPKDNAAVNGDFEEGPWSNRAVRYVDAAHFSVPGGKRAVELLSGKEGIISQMVATTPAKNYALTFTLGAAGDACQPPLAVMAFAADQTGAFHYSPTGNATSHLANLTFVARADRTRVAFYSVYYNTRSDDRSSLCGPVVDDVRVWALSRATAAARVGRAGLALALAAAALIFV
uniref:DUF642 domain-containing protein n=1 Tax=Ananas comosus var. bracteatus TaxID=296719 RepID=A0A6V7PUF6_ANACO|nr:unnamed protein product [Ananas comosus var. bracteatus]